MATKLDSDAATVERAEQLIGTRIRALEGGCGCDALVASVAPSAPDPQRVDQVSDRSDSTTAATTPDSAASLRRDVSPGRILTLGDPFELSGHLHRAILRNATEMITANQSGLVEVLAIPWDQVQRR